MVEDIKSYISRLIALYETQKERAEFLSAGLAKKEEEILGYREQIADLNQQIDNLALKDGFVSGSDSVQARERIDGLIREIDKCIRLLEN